MGNLSLIIPLDHPTEGTGASQGHSRALIHTREDRIQGFLDIPGVLLLADLRNRFVRSFQMHRKTILAE